MPWFPLELWGHLIAVTSAASVFSKLEHVKHFLVTHLEEVNSMNILKAFVLLSGMPFPLLVNLGMHFHHM